MDASSTSDSLTGLDLRNCLTFFNICVFTDGTQAAAKTRQSSMRSWKFLNQNKLSFTVLQCSRLSRFSVSSPLHQLPWPACGQQVKGGDFSLFNLLLWDPTWSSVSSSRASNIRVTWTCWSKFRGEAHQRCSSPVRTGCETQLVLIRMEKRRFQGDLTAASQYLERAYKKAGQRLLTRACSDRTSINGFKLQEERFRLDVLTSLQT